MKRNLLFHLLVLIILASTDYSIAQSIKGRPSGPIQNNSNMTKHDDPRWQRVDSLSNSGLPESALEIVATLMVEAIETNNIPVLVKANLYELKLRSQFEENFLIRYIYEKEQILANEQQKSPYEQLIHSILGEVYWQYYQMNSHRILDRSISSVDNQSIVPDFNQPIETWDGEQFVRASSFHYHASLYEKELLQQISLKDYDEILERGNNSKIFRPTLYDFLAHRAVDFFMREEPLITKPANRFIINDPLLFAEADKFVALQINTEDTLSFKYRTVKLFQDLISSHLNDDNPEALVDADLKRLDFIRQNLNSPDKDSLYLAALMELENKYKGQTASASVMEKIANYYYEAPEPPIGILKTSGSSDEPIQDLVKAREWCLKAIQNFPKTEAATNCRFIVDQIEKPSLSFFSYSEAPAGKEFPLLLNYKNINKVWLRLVKTDFIFSGNLYSKRDEILYNILAMNPVHSWNQDLTDLKDYKLNSTELIIPAIESGQYILIISSTGAFTVKDSLQAWGAIHVSNISYITRTDPKGSGLIYVLDRNTGTPLKNVKAQSFTLTYDYKTRNFKRSDKKLYTSDADGRINVIESNSVNLSFEFSHRNDTLVAENVLNIFKRNHYPERKRLQTYLFTDRAIYRPGQTVHFKGIVVSKTENRKEDPALDEFKNSLAKGERSEVRMFDVNGQQISIEKLVTNDFGSFSGSFVLPSSGLTGMYSIQNETGSVYFNVEEYKRPRFEVTFNEIDSSNRIGELVTITGNANSYSGVPLTGATVNYRVVRSTYFPFFRYSYRIWPPYRVPDAEITSGTMQVSDDGSFKITFRADADPSRFGNNYPLYTFTIYADVTDLNGETQSGETSVNISDKALLLEADIDDEINSKGVKPFTVKATNLQGRPVTAQVSVELHLLKEEELELPRQWEQPITLHYSKEEFKTKLPNYPYSRKSENYEKEKLVYSTSLNTATDSLVDLATLNLEPGRYLITLKAPDKFGNEAITEKQISVYNPESRKLPYPTYLWFTTLNNKPEQGDVISFLAGSSVNGRLLVEIQSKSKILLHKWYEVKGQKKYEFDLPDDLTGSVEILATLVYQNNVFSEKRNITIPDKSKELKFAFETFRSKLTPGSTEKWRIKITGSEGEALSAELMAGMYDASLDAFTTSEWNFALADQWQFNYNWNLTKSFSSEFSFVKYFDQNVPEMPEPRSYDRLNWFGYENYYGGFQGGIFTRSLGRTKNMAFEEADQEELFMITDDVVQANAEASPPTTTSSSKIQKPTPQIRRNLNETAFFYPHLKTDDKGELWIEFTVPEALTRWNFRGLAHTENLKTSTFSKEVVTQKEIMVTPNLPRFFREGDKMVIQSKITNLTSNPVQGEATLELVNPFTMQPVDALFFNKIVDKSFEIKPEGSTIAEWEIEVPELQEAVIVRITAVAGNHSDGEEVIIPVFINRMMVTETMPLPINGNESKEFKFSALTSENVSNTRVNHKLTLEFTSNPAWYALQSLPWLESRENENSDQLFNRYYVNSLASFIANSSPKLKNVFETWRLSSPETFLSQLEKNQELKTLILNETPWVMDARNEAEQKQRVAMLFDLNRLSNEQATALRRLKQNQTINGGWPWFEGMPESRYITQLIVTGLGKLHYLKVINLDDQELKTMVQSAVDFLSDKIVEDYNQIQKSLKDKKTPNKGTDHLSYEQIQFLYAVSYLQGIASPGEESREAISFFSEQARKYFPTKSLYAQAMIGLWAGKSGDLKTTNAIISSLREKYISNEEMGIYWRDNKGGYYWYQAPIETQAILIELFEEMGSRVDRMSNKGIENSARAASEVDKMKTWLIKQKQTHSWPSSTATAEAIYALMIRSTDWLQTDRSVDIVIGGKQIDFTDVKTETGTGYFKKSWSGEEITKTMGNVAVTKTSEGPAWGALYLQYFEDIDKVKAHDSPLKITRQLFIKENTTAGQRIIPINEGRKLKVGDQVVVRVEIISDRDMEYIHLKDARASAFEPTETLSGYEWKAGLGYYRSTKDASVDFFFYYLPKGTHVFEYNLVVSRSGDYSNGLSNIQCMYAPEFSAHSEGSRVIIDQ